MKSVANVNVKCTKQRTALFARFLSLSRITPAYYMARPVANEC